MRKSKFTESQVVGILKEAESGVPVADLAFSIRATTSIWPRGVTATTFRYQCTTQRCHWAFG